VASPGLIVDRDGTLVEERGYISDPADLVPLPGVATALARARDAGVVVAVVTNQSAVGRGLVTESQLAVLHQRLTWLGVEAVYYCPHLPDAGCDCRKPLPGLVRRAIDELQLDTARTVLVGDHLTDCMAARAAGVDAMLVLTGHGATHASVARDGGFVVVADLPTAVDRFLAELRTTAPTGFDDDSR
jgi:D-glycero-D-manno-heptose 1,7-bisphosphate phosphatase